VGRTQASELRERLLEAGSPEATFGVLECALLNRLQRPLLAHPAVAYALRQLAAADGLWRETFYGVVSQRSGFNSESILPHHAVPKCD